jgi:hypothetical protein
MQRGDVTEPIQVTSENWIASHFNLCFPQDASFILLNCDSDLT